MKNTFAILSPGELFHNYELSWLKFNWRVLAEAEREELPLLERVKFISIVCSNLDEVYHKRVRWLKRQQHAAVTDLSPDMRTRRQQLHDIRKEVKKMMERYRICYH